METVKLEKNDIYRVGFFRDISNLCGYWRNAPGSIPHKMRITCRIFKSSLFSYKNYWKGFLAEPDPWPDNGLQNCGHGWTRKRALKKLNYYSRTQADGTGYDV